MIIFDWQGKTLSIKIDYGIFIGQRSYELRNDLNEIDATLRALRLNDEMDSKLKKIHEKAYEKGWNDHKKKQPKQDYFDFGWEPMK